VDGTATLNAASAPVDPATARPVRATTIAILAMGGEGGGVLADWLVDVAEHAGYYAQTTSVPGVAQRTGATIYYLEIFPADARPNGRVPVLALMPVPGEVDVVIASELMEAGRAVQRGLVTPDRTTFIASTNRVYSMTERTAMADGRVDADALLKAGKAAAKVFVAEDFARIADDTGSVISAALFGALAATTVLPFTRAQYEEAIERGGVGVTSSVAAFAAGYAAAGADASGAAAPARAASPPTQPAASVGPRLRELARRVEHQFPPASHPIVMAGITRLGDYQDVRYAALYLDRLDPIRDLDATHGGGDFALLREAGRHLALWMAYEDAIRVADLKTRRARFERVYSESRATPNQLLRINDYLHPRLDELSDILPAGIGRWLLRSRWAASLVNRLTRRGQIVTTSSLGGFLQLYFIASLRRGRRRSLRFQREQQAIESWLAQVVALAPQDYVLATAVAECPRLVKGYGDTHTRGFQNFNTLIATLPAVRRRADPAAALRKLRDAALADDTGDKLQAALKELE
jgi:indolepyruvate ferredoxin oxidoreductase beta subunit